MIDAAVVVPVEASPRAGALPEMAGRLSLAARAAAYSAMLLDTLHAAALAHADVLCVCGGAAGSDLRALLGESATLREEEPAPMPRLAESAMDDAFANGYKSVVAMTAVAPDLPPAYLSTAFRRLREERGLVALGPTLAGGLYLIGLAEPFPALFGATVWEPGVASLGARLAAERAGRPLAILPRWQSVQTAGDLADACRRGGAVNLCGVVDAGVVRLPVEEGWR